MSANKVMVGVVLAGMLAGLLAGCGGSKVSKSNYEKIQNNMTQKEVEDILGEGTEKAGAGGALGELTASGKVISWKDGEKEIDVTFVNGKVVAKTQSGL